MNIVNLKPCVDPPVQMCESLVSLAQGVAMVAEDVVRLNVSASSRNDITDALLSAACAIYQAAKAMDTAYRQETLMAGSCP